MQAYFQLLNPLVFLIFAAALVGLHRSNRDLRGADWLAASYVLGACAFAAEFFRAESFSMTAGAIVNMLYVVTSSLFTAGIILRHRDTAPLRLIAVSAFLACAIYMVVHYYNNDPYAEGAVMARTYAAHLTNAAIILIGLVFAAPYARKTIDKVIVATVAVYAAQLIVRPVLIDIFANESLTPANYATSAYFLTFQLAIGLCAISMGVCLVVAYSMDVMSDLSHRSVSDSLSGVLNRRGFEEQAAAILADADQTADPVSIILIDIDHFKSINDNFGHAFGDKVIEQLGRMLKAYHNAGRITGRLGGEEFALLAPACRLDDAINIAEALRRKFAAERFQSGEGTQCFTASFGVATRHEREHVLDMMARADEAMYHSKTAGRNRVTSETELQVSKLEGALDALERRKFRRPESGADRKTA